LSSDKTFKDIIFEFGFRLIFTLKDELPHPYPWSIGVQYATGEEWRNSYRKNEEAEPKQK